MDSLAGIPSGKRRSPMRCEKTSPCLHEKKTISTGCPWKRRRPAEPNQLRGIFDEARKLIPEALPFFQTLRTISFALALKSVPAMVATEAGDDYGSFTYWLSGTGIAGRCKRSPIFSFIRTGTPRLADCLRSLIPEAIRVSTMEDASRQRPITASSTKLAVCCASG